MTRATFRNLNRFSVKSFSWSICDWIECILTWELMKMNESVLKSKRAFIYNYVSNCFSFCVCFWCHSILKLRFSLVFFLIFFHSFFLFQFLHLEVIVISNNWYLLKQKLLLFTQIHSNSIFWVSSVLQTWAWKSMFKDV